MSGFWGRCHWDAEYERQQLVAGAWPAKLKGTFGT